MVAGGIVVGVADVAIFICLSEFVVVILFEVDVVLICFTENSVYGIKINMVQGLNYGINCNWKV